MGVKVKRKVIPANFLKIEGRVMLVGQELVGDQNPGPEAPPWSKKGREREGSKGDVRGGAMEKSRYVRVIEGKQIRRDDPIEYFLPTNLGLPFESQRG